MVHVRRLALAVVVGAALGASGSLAPVVVGALAQGSGSGAGAPAAKGSGSGSGAEVAPKGQMSPASKAFAEINEKMHKEMNITFSGDTDVDFVKGMIPHHQGAVDMARVILKHGTDPDLKKFAEGIISAQESEIVFMRAWLQKMGK